MLAMKPGERPTNFERRRDLWLIPHSQKILTRMVNVEYDRAARRCVLSSQAGFTPGRNAGEHALAMRLAAEQAMVERKPLYREESTCSGLGALVLGAMVPGALVPRACTAA